MGLKFGGTCGLVKVMRRFCEIPVAVEAEDLSCLHDATVTNKVERHVTSRHVRVKVPKVHMLLFLPNAAGNIRSSTCHESSHIHSLTRFFTCTLSPMLDVLPHMASCLLIGQLESPKTPKMCLKNSCGFIYSGKILEKIIWKSKHKGMKVEQ